MKIRVVSSKDEINSLGKRERIIHLAFRPSSKDIFTLIQKCPEVEAIHVPSSYFKTISDSTKMFLSIQNVSLLVGDVWGHRKDINEYYEIDQEVFDRIEEFKTKGLSETEILKRMERIPGPSKDLLQFILKEEQKK